METGLIVLLVLAAAAGTGVLVVRHKLRKISRAAFGTDSFIEGMKRQEEELSRIPKSVSGMTKLCLPRIQRDFPEFSFEEFKRKSENLLKAALTAVERQDMAFLSGASPELKRQISLKIEDDKRQGLKRAYQGIRIHQTEIAKYEKTGGNCLITFQSAVEYKTAKWKEGEERPELKRVQTRYDMEWIYIQDVEKLPEDRRSRAINCPNCGAPLTNLGAKFCEYCGSALEVISIRVWSMENIKEN